MYNNQVELLHYDKSLSASKLLKDTDFGVMDSNQHADNNRLTTFLVASVLYCRETESMVGLINGITLHV